MAERPKKPLNQLIRFLVRALSAGHKRHTQVCLGYSLFGWVANGSMQPDASVACAPDATRRAGGALQPKESATPDLAPPLGESECFRIQDGDRNLEAPSLSHVQVERKKSFRDKRGYPALVRLHWKQPLTFHPIRHRK
jgi:hypothetical protein